MESFVYKITNSPTKSHVDYMDLTIPIKYWTKPKQLIKYFMGIAKSTT